MDPERLGRYEIEGLLGEGGMGTVYAARDPESGDRVALKVLAGALEQDDQRFLRFEQEASALARLDHENVVKLLGPIERDGTKTFFAMERLEGETLAARLRREGPMPVPVALGYARPLLRALSAAHAAGVIHRDIKPSNVFLSGDRVIVTDFGLARMADLTRLTQTGQLMGTLDYMSPEQCDGEEVDERTDLYSVGIILFEMLTGTAPFRRATPGATIKGHLTETPSRLDRIRADLPGGLADVVERLLEKDRENRYATADEVFDALRDVPDPSMTASFLPGFAPGRVSSGTTRIEGPARTPGRWLYALAAVVVLAAVAAGIALTRDGAPNPDDPAKAPYAGRKSPEAVIETIHQAIGRRDWDTFADCFAMGSLGRFFSAAPEREFLARAERVTDVRYEVRQVEIPDDRPPRPGRPNRRGARRRDLVRTVIGTALPAVLAPDSGGQPIHLAFVRNPDGFRVRGVIEESVRRLLASEDSLRRARVALKERVDAFLENPFREAREVLNRYVAEGKFTEDQLKGLRRLVQSGRIEPEIVDDPEFVRETATARVFVKADGVARVLGHDGQQLELVYRYRLARGRWVLEEIGFDEG